jgi:hypothetical protein
MRALCCGRGAAALHDAGCALREDGPHPFAAFFGFGILDVTMGDPGDELSTKIQYNIKQRKTDKGHNETPPPSDDRNPLRTPL